MAMRNPGTMICFVDYRGGRNKFRDPGLTGPLITGLLIVLDIPILGSTYLAWFSDHLNCTVYCYRGEVVMLDYSQH